MLGIADPQILLAYLACILSALGCMVYGALHWKGEDKEQAVKNQPLPRNSVRMEGLLSRYVYALALWLTFDSPCLMYLGHLEKVHCLPSASVMD